MEYTISVKKRIIAFILALFVCVNVIVFDTLKVKAIGPLDIFLTVTMAIITGVESSSTYQTAYEDFIRPKTREAIREILSVASGQTVDTETFDRVFPYFIGDPWQEARLWLADKLGEDPSDISESDSKQALYQMFYNSEISGNNVVISSDLKSFVDYIADKYKNDCGYYYVYSTPLSQKLNDFSDGTLYNATRQFLNDNPNAIISMTNTNNYGHVGILSLEYDNNLGLVEEIVYPSGNAYGGSGHNIDDWAARTLSFYSYSDGVFTLDNSNVSQVGYFKYYKYEENIPINMNAFNFCAITKEAKTFIMFKTLADLKRYSVGLLPYYINQPVNNTWNSSTGDYTVTTDNSNKISYGDISNYINSFNTENGEYPTLQDIQVYIDNNIPSGSGGGGSGGGSSTGTGSATATANNEGININIYNNHSLNFGGSSVSDNTVSGNGVSGGGGGIGNIFDFLSQIGDVLGNLIKNIGHVLAELVTGIGETISALLEGIPTIFGDFMGALLGWLPAELQALITLSISAMIIVGVIKLFRG